MIAKAGVVFASFFLLLATWGGEAAGQNRPEGELTIAFDASIAPTFLDPAETSGLSTPFVFLYALHDALIKPLAGLSGVLCHAGHRRGLDRAQEIHREGRRGRLWPPSRGAGALSVCADEPGHRAGARGE